MPSKKQHTMSTAWWEKTLSTPHVTMLSVLFIIAALITHQLLPQHIQALIANIASIPVVTAILLTGIMIIGYFNWISGVVAIVLLAAILLPSIQVSRYGKSPINEGFTSAEEEESDDFSDTQNIKSLFQPGFLRKKLADARKIGRSVAEEKSAREKMEKFIDKRSGKHQNNNSGSNRERFSNNGAKAVEMRRFNPGSEEDANLLLTMDAMDDIKDRIKYKYEDKKYLKRYIRQKLEEVVDLLDLVPADE